MPIQTSRARQKALLRQEIIDAARDILAREGYAQLSMRRVAERIEYSPTAIYLHFEDKSDLVFHVREDTFGRILTELESLETEFKDPVTRLREGMRRYVAFGLRYPQHYLATFVAVSLDHAPQDAARYNHPESNGMRALAILRAWVVACVDAGKFKKADAEVTTRAIWAAMHGVTSLLIQMPNFSWGDQKAVVEGVIDAVIDGLRPRPARRSRVPGAAV